MIKFPEYRKIILLTHHNADIDAICSSTALLYGLEQKNIRAKIGVANSVAKQAKSVLEYAGTKVIINPTLENYDVIFVLDTAVPEQLEPMKLPKDKEIIVIDHHENTKIKGTEELIAPRRKATCELILKVLKDNDVRITKKIANLLLAGIISDTNHFKFADNVTFKLVSELLTYHADLSFVFDLIHNPPEFKERLAKLKGIRNLEIYRTNNCLIAALEVKEFEAAVARGAIALGADISIVFAEMESELRVSARANARIVRDANLNLGQEIFSKIGDIAAGSGGGHDAAGSLNTPDKDKKKEIRKFIFEKLEEKIGKLEKV
ncbi:MAG: DHH family phosphoesterase [Candidatus Aenigmarchaeota archaeon]|nr:DHH family phosphoesterase [Candidatus Aenigmarchaeota archaeon]